MLISVRGEIFQHYKGNFYVYVGEGMEIHTGKTMVAYESVESPHQMFFREKSEFFGLSGTGQQRFKKLPCYEVH